MAHSFLLDREVDSTVFLFAGMKHDWSVKNVPDCLSLHVAICSEGKHYHYFSAKSREKSKKFSLVIEKPRGYISTGSSFIRCKDRKCQKR